MNPEIFTDDFEFPTLPPDAIPEDRVALSTIFSGQRGLGGLYDSLQQHCTGETRFLVTMLQRDWRERFEGLLAQWKELLRSRGATEKTSSKLLPTSEQIEKVVDALKDEKPPVVARLIEEFASRVLVCHKLVPWKSDVYRVFEHFQSCLEAEDGHLSVLDLFCGLLAEQGE